jgi:hypothetical protein
MSKNDIELWGNSLQSEMISQNTFSNNIILSFRVTIYSTFLGNEENNLTVNEKDCLRIYLFSTQLEYYSVQ